MSPTRTTRSSWEAAALPPLEAFPKAHAAAIRALQLEPSLAEAHTPLGYASTHYLWDWQQAAQQFERALALNPDYLHARHWYSHFLMAQGRRGVWSPSRLIRPRGVRRAR